MPPLIVRKYIKWDGFLASHWQAYPAIYSDLPHRLVFAGDTIFVLTFDPRLDARQRLNAVHFFEDQRRRFVTLRPVQRITA